MIESFIAGLLEGAGIPSDRAAEILAPVTEIVGNLSMLDMFTIMGRLMAIKALADADDLAGAEQAVRELADNFGLNGLVDELAAALTPTVGAD